MIGEVIDNAEARVKLYDLRFRTQIKKFLALIGVLLYAVHKSWAFYIDADLGNDQYIYWITWASVIVFLTWMLAPIRFAIFALFGMVAGGLDDKDLTQSAKDGIEIFAKVMTGILMWFTFVEVSIFSMRLEKDTFAFQSTLLWGLVLAIAVAHFGTKSRWIQMTVIFVTATIMTVSGMWRMAPAEVKGVLNDIPALVQGLKPATAPAVAGSTNNMVEKHKLTLKPGEPVVVQVPSHQCSQADDGKPGVSFTRKVSNDGVNWQDPARGKWSLVRYTANDGETTITHEVRPSGTCDP